MLIRNSKFIDRAHRETSLLNTQWRNQIEGHYLICAAHAPNECCIRRLPITRSVALRVEIDDDAIERIGFYTADNRGPLETNGDGAKSRGIAWRSQFVDPSESRLAFDRIGWAQRAFCFAIVDSQLASSPRRRQHLGGCDRSTTNPHTRPKQRRCERHQN